MTIRSFVRPLFVALSLALATTAAAPAFADNAKDTKAQHAKGHGKGKGHGKDKDKAEKKFPMPGDKFSKVVEGRLSKAREKLGSALSKNGVADAKKAEILKEFDKGATAVRDAAKTAAKDGQVTKEEAKTVRASAKALKKELRDKYLPKKKDAKDAPKDV